ncbi:MAG: P63C domain-containing protein [Methylocella sp.]
MKQKLRKATHDGTLTIGDLKIPCYVLEDGTRILSQRGLNEAFGITHGGGIQDGGQRTPRFIALKALEPFISKDLTAGIFDPIEFAAPHGGRSVIGIPATALVDICNVWLKAREAKALTTERQLSTAQKAEILTRGLAHVGIIALIDEATGYQDVRDRLALQAILDAYLRKELAAWAKRFPEEFYRQIFRLREWQWRGMKVNRPQIVAKYTNDLVYERLAPGILEELQRRNPKDEKGQRQAKHHQWLTEDVGHPALAQHLHAVIGFMRASARWDQFYRLLQRAFPKKGQNLELPLGD